jgi:hypothetical protein
LFDVDAQLGAKTNLAIAADNRSEPQARAS